MKIEYDVRDHQSGPQLTAGARAELERILRGVLPEGSVNDKANMNKGGYVYSREGAYLTAPYLNIWFGHAAGCAGSVKLTVQAYEWDVLYEVLAQAKSPLVEWIPRRIQKLFLAKEQDRDTIGGLKIAARQWNPAGALMKRVGAILLAHEITG